MSYTKLSAETRSVATNWDDVSARQHMTRLAQVAQATASIIIVTDLSGAIVWVNESFTRVTGYQLQEVHGRRPGDVLQGSDTDRSEIARIGAAVRARQSVSAELINYAKDGKKYWVGMKIQPILDVNGTIDGFMAIEADITARLEQRLALELSTARFNLATRAARIGVYEREANDGEVWWSENMWEIFGQDPAFFKPTLEALAALIHPDDRERVNAESKKPGALNSAWT